MFPHRLFFFALFLLLSFTALVFLLDLRFSCRVNSVPVEITVSTNSFTRPIMLSSSLVSIALLPSFSLATFLFVSSYNGSLTTLSLTETGDTFDLAVSSVLKNSCGTSPSWLVYSSAFSVSYCIDEGLNVPNGTLETIEVDDDGELFLDSSLVTIDGGVNGVIYAGGSALAVAHYEDSAISTWSLSTPFKPGALINEPIFFTMPAPGPNPVRQDAPHPHQVILDPTENFLLSPDLGADLVRVFTVDFDTDDLTACDPLVAAPGSGPRHAVFWSPSDDTSTASQKRHPRDLHPRQATDETILYLVSELANTVTAYSVTYPEGGCLAFSEIQVESSLGPGVTNANATVAEIHVNGNNLLVSNRGDNTFGANNDSMAAFAISPNGEFTFTGLSPAYGSFPRDFTINAAGDMVAIGLQMSGSVVIVERDPETGEMGSKIGEVDGLGMVTCIVWDEPN